MTNDEIRARLLQLQDLKYKDFHCKLIPGVDRDRVIGVRVPQLRAFAKELFKSGEYEEFLAVMPHEYYDEMNLHGFIVCELKDYERVISEIDRMLPYIDNWATCDLISPKKAFRKNLNQLLLDIRRWMSSDDTYTIRFGIEMLMTFYLDDNFSPEHLEWVESIKSDEYYVNMMIAWYFATALAKQYDATIPYIEDRMLGEWTHRKTIQKARESNRIDRDTKEYLKSLK